MSQDLSKSRLEMARALAELDFSLKSSLNPVQYQQISRRLGTLMKTSSEYLTAFAAAKHQCDGKVLVPRYLSDEMRRAIEGGANPVEAWHGALNAAGVE